MLNREVYLKDPQTRSLLNEGVAYVNDENLEVLRYELETFVCDGQYEKGLEHILRTFNSNLGKPKQPGVWVSGFFGSGKSHLVKILKALWTDVTFPDGATARGITNLPESIKNELIELSTLAKQHGYLHAAAGRLDSGARGSVRLALMSIIFKSVGLPEQFNIAKFILWLKAEGILEAVKTHVKNQGENFDEEISHLQFSTPIHEALKVIKPDVFNEATNFLQTFTALYPPRDDISNEEMIEFINKALKVNGKFPLTLIALDEVQQFIGEDAQKSFDIQNIIENCSTSFNGNLLFIATGQTAVTGTANLKKLEGRFTIRIELSDADVEAVIRKVILAKKPSAIDKIKSIIQENIGEISRHLSGTSINHRQEDVEIFYQDYPILPTRRRFWENALRVLDRTGTDNQLRNQLSMIHKVIQTNLDKEIGNFVSADYLYFESAEKLLQSRVLPQKIYRETMRMKNGNPDERIIAKACGVIFLINKLSSANKELGIKANIDSIVDLLIEDLNSGSANLRAKLPALLDKCDILMKVGDEYRIQTEESTAWNDEFLSNKNLIGNETHRVESERDDRIKKKIAEATNRISLTQGESAVPREIKLIFDLNAPPDCDKRIYLWIRDGWNTDERTIQSEARAQGFASPTIFLYIPKRSADDLRSQIIDYKASFQTLERRGSPQTPEGMEAKAAMETIKQNSEAKIKELINEMISGAKVYQAGGNEIINSDLQSSITEAAKASLQRLYDHFDIADHPNWGKVYEKAKSGAPDALKAVGFDGEIKTHPVCKKIMEFIGAGKKGADIRGNFEQPPFGWSGDAIDGAIQLLLVSGLLKCANEQGNPVDPKELERKSIGKFSFKLESTNITATQKIELRKLFSEIDILATPGNESDSANQFIERIILLHQNAGGEAPCPDRPTNPILQDLRRLSGNELLATLHQNKESLSESIRSYRKISEKIKERMSEWETLQRLKSYAKTIPNSDIIFTQIDQIKNSRQLLAEPNPLPQLSTSLTQLLRDEVNRLASSFGSKLEHGKKKISTDSYWNRLGQEDKTKLLINKGLDDQSLPQINVATTGDVISTLEKISIPVLSEKLESMDSKFSSLIAEAAKILEPKAEVYYPPRQTLKNEAELEEWVAKVKSEISAKIKNGPVTIQ